LNNTGNFIMKKFPLLLATPVVVAILLLFLLYRARYATYEGIVVPSIVVTGSAGAHDGAGDNYPVVRQLGYGEHYPITGQDATNTWWQVVVDGGVYWVEASEVAAVNVENVPTLGVVAVPCVRIFAPACPVSYNPAHVLLQMFENGIMVQFADRPQIYVFFTGDMMMSYYEVDNYESRYFPTETPPEGFYRPEGSFEHIWLNSPGLRDSLGWATGIQVDYQTTIESYLGSYSPHDDVSYLQLPDDRAIAFDILSSYWSFAEPSQ
jgi:hypothetical protein